MGKLVCDTWSGSNIVIKNIITIYTKSTRVSKGSKSKHYVTSPLENTFHVVLFSSIVLYVFILQLYMQCHAFHCLDTPPKILGFQHMPTSITKVNMKIIAFLCIKYVIHMLNIVTSKDIINVFY